MAKFYRRSLLILAIISLWVYIVWRILYTLPQGYPLFFAIMLLMAEIIQAFQSTLFYILMYNPTTRVSPPLPKCLWTIDILVTTYNEDTEILKRTLIACKNLDYPNKKLKIWLCDDGNRPEVCSLAKELGVGYITRPTNEHAKAGNLNNALKHINGELVVTLDADMVPKSSFLKETVGFFKDQNLAFVQTPQSFYNMDIFQYNLFQSRRIPNEQDLFMRLIQAGRDRFNAAIYVGSNTVFRRKAIDSIGGFATGTITEDIATGMLLQSKGYKSIYLNEVLAQGLSAESFRDFLTQRIRWARGTIQTVRKWNPLFLSGLSLMQRLLYISALIYWYNGLFKIIFIISPLLFLLFGIPVLKATFTGIAFFWLPQFLLANLVFRNNTNKIRDMFWSHLYETASAPAVCWAALVETIFSKPVSFKVTPKGILADKMRFHLDIIITQLILSVLSFLAIIKGGLLLFDVKLRTGLSINMFWNGYNLIGLLGAVMLGWERPRVRKTERFIRHYSVDILDNAKQQQSIKARTQDISDSGCRLILDQVYPLSEKVTLLIHGRSEHELNGKIVYYDTFEDGYHVGITFEAISMEANYKWIRELYGEKPNESAFELQDYGTSWVGFFTRYFSEFRLHYQSKERKAPRISANIQCSILFITTEEYITMQQVAASLDTNVILDGQEVTNRFLRAQIYDLSYGGCQVYIQANLTQEYAKKCLIQVSGLNNLLTGDILETKAAENNEIIIRVSWADNLSDKQLSRLIINQEN